jgi:multicomponent Na+:H+ antiporter subunit B
MRGYELLKSICRLVLPFIILYGLYVILNGDLSPGGGFQGGVVMATCYLVIFFIKDEESITFKEIVKIEKALFVTLILMTILHLLTYRAGLAWFPIKSWTIHISTMTLILLNLIIGLKVTIGFWGIMLIFTEEGRL